MPDDDARPNIVIVFMDDMGYGEMGCFGSTMIRTPTMDRIAADGAKFTQMYAAGPVCSPSRAGLLTGRYGQRMDIERVLFPKDEKGIGDAERTFGDYLRSAGYATCMLGKWHVGCRGEHNPIRHGFDEYFGLLYSNDMDPLHLYRGEEAIETEVDQATLTRRYADEAIRFIERNKDRPFIVYLAHTMPHIPLHVEPEFRGKSAAGTYGDTIECIDHHLERIMKRLRELRLIEKTLVIVTSDNGPWYEGSTGGLRGRKFQNYEGGIRVPFVAQWDRTVTPGTVCDEATSLMDMLPTFLRLAGVAPDGPPMDGIDIWDAFLGRPTPERDALYHYFCYELNAVRCGRWKLHVSVGAGERRSTAEMPQLFDIDSDPQESYNLANLHPNLVEQLVEKIRAFDAEIQSARPSEQT